jgi:hypothetical protein
MGVTELRFAVGADQQHCERPLGANQVAQQEQGRGGGPVEVVEHKQRPAGDLEQGADRLEEREPLRLGVAQGRLAKRLELGQESAKLGSERSEFGREAVPSERAGVGAERLDERLVGRGEALITAPVEHEHPGCLDGAGQLRGEPGLADARLASQEHHCALAVSPQIL